jgi:hypothetical protein
MASPFLWARFYLKSGLSALRLAGGPTHSFYVRTTTNEAAPLVALFDEWVPRTQCLASKSPVPQVRARSLIFRLVTPVLRALTWASPYSEGDSPRGHSNMSSCAIRPTQFAHFTFPNSGTVFRAHPLSP